jgi:hypothetical protein
MANSFSKEEKVAFDMALEGFQDQLVISKMFKKQTFDGTEAERTGNTFWRPQPYIAQSFTGRDQTANFGRNYTQLSVPASLGYSHSVPLTLSATELRDALQEQKLGKAAMQRLGSDINLDCSNLAALTGTVAIKRGAATGYDDIAAADDAFNRVGIDMNDRRVTLPSGHYNKMAGNLAQRQTVAGKVQTAYEKAFVGQIANFDTYKLDYGYRLTAAAGTTVSVNGAAQYYVPKSTSTAATGETSNVDNRYQNLTIGVASGTVKVGDAFTIAGVNEVHHITKQDTGSLKTFRVAGIVSGAGGAGVISISPPIIAGAAGGGSDAEKQYQNVTAAPVNGAAITFLNTVSSVVAPFWHGEAFEILPGKYQPKEESGLAIMSGTTDNGITVTMARQGQIGSLDTFYRWDVYYGLVNLQPQMSGVMLFDQT